MPEYLSPGVYVEELPSGSMPIQAASTSTAGMVGMTARGPANVPTLVTSFGAYSRTFGGRLDPLVFTGGRDTLPYAAEGFFVNGGSRLYVVRVLGDSAAEATLLLTGTFTTTTTLTAEAAASATALNFASTDGLVVGTKVRVAGKEATVSAINGPVVTIAAAIGSTSPKDSEVTYPTTTTTTLTAEVAADATDLNFASTDGLVVGATVRVADKEATVSAINGQVVTIAAAIGSVSPNASPVTYPATTTTMLTAEVAADATDLNFASTDGLVVGATVRVADKEATVSAINGQVVTIAAAIGSVSPNASPVTYPTSTTTTLTAEAAVDATALNFASTDGLVVGTKVRVAGKEATVSAINGPVVTIVAAIGSTSPKDSEVTYQAAALLLTVHARWPGVWGNALRVSTKASPLVSTSLAEKAELGAKQIRLATAFGLFAGSVIVINPAGNAERIEVAKVNTSTGEVTLTTVLANSADKDAKVVSQEFSITIERIEDGKAVESETFDRLSLAPTHPRYALNIVGSWDKTTAAPSDSGGSQLVRLEDHADAATRMLSFQVVSDRALLNGDDDLAHVDDTDYIGISSDDPGGRTGIQALENESSLSIVAVPGITSVAVEQALVAHCEKMRYRFAALEVPLGSNLGAARTHRQNFDTTRAAVYYPGLVIADSFGNPGDRRVIPSAGHVLGIYARTDITRGVHKAPANEVVRGVLGFEVALAKGEQDILNPINLNCFRDFRSENRGLRLFGARVSTSDSSLRYISVRRLLLMIEQSLDTGLQWAVFEPNSEATWATVKQSVTGFLTTVWRNGALEGTKAEEAFYVNIGYDITMTQDDIDNGRMIVEIGVAPVKPAEFVIIRISQKTREATS